MAESTPTVLRNRYRVLDRLGAGGGGTVYTVEDLFAEPARWGRPLALKAVFCEDTSSCLEILRHEFRILAVLRHPLIGRVYDFGRIPSGSRLPGAQRRSGYFFTRDLIEGQDLKAHCVDLDVAGISRVCQRTAEVLDVLHRAGMVHGDLKPANVIVGADGRPHLIDFGLVRTEGESFGSSGTLPYLAPEILCGQREDRRADLFSLGITLFQLLTARLPLRPGSVEEIAAWHRQRGPLRVTAEREVPLALERIVQRLTHPDPDQRFPTAGELALALADVADRAGSPTEPTGPRPFVAPAPGGNLVQPLQRLEQLVEGRLLKRAGGPTLVGLVGEVGSGKSTLLQELAWRAQLAGIEVIRAEFRSDDLRGYGPWQDLLTQAAGVSGTPHPLRAPDLPVTEPFGLFQHVSDYLSRSTVPLVLLLDNGEQADHESLALLRFVSRTLDPQSAAMLVVAFRPLPDLPRQLGHPVCLQLIPLSLEDVGRMAEDASGRRDDGLAAELHAMTGGNPMFVLELLEALARQGWPARPNLAGLLPPLHLEELYTHRLRALDPGQQAVLESLAVAGFPLTLQQLHQLHLEARESAERLPNDVDELQGREWLDRSWDGSYQLRQPHVARLLYQQIPPRRRQALHLATLKLLERSGPRNAVAWTRHAIGAGRLDLALETLDAAVSGLRELAAHRAAIQLLESAVPLLEQDSARLRDARHELGELCLALGDYARAKRELTLALLDASGAAAHRIRTALARAHRLTGEGPAAEAILRQVLESDTAPLDRVAALAELAESQQARDAHRQALDTVDEALRLLGEEEAPDLVVRAQLHGQQALSLGLVDDFAAAEAAWQRALADAQACGDSRAEANILNRWAITALRQGEVAEVPSRYATALIAARRSGDVERVAAIQFNLAAFHLFQGELGPAYELMPKCVRLFEAMGAQKNLAHGYGSLGHLELELGLHERARSTLERAVAAAREVGSRSIEGYALLNLGLVQAHRGWPDEARRHLTGARDLYLELQQPTDAADALLDLAELELNDGQPDRCRDAVDTARQLATDLPPHLTIRATLLEARVLLLVGAPPEIERALVQLREALARAKQHGLRRLAWQCHAAAMELEQQRGKPEDARDHARVALAILERMAADLPPDVLLAFWQHRWRRAVRDCVHPDLVEDHAERHLAPEELAAFDALQESADTIREERTLPPPSSMATMLELKGIPRR